MAAEITVTSRRDFRQSRRRWTDVVLGFAACCVLLVANIMGCDEQSATDQGKIRVSLNPWPGYGFLFLAEEKGFFRQESLNVRLMEFDSLSDARRVFEQGQADVLCCSLVELLMMNERLQADPAAAFSVADYSNGGDMLIAKDSITSLGDLRGRRIGLEPESLDGLCVYLALKSVGMTLSDVTIVPLSQSDMENAIESDTVDAVQVYPPCSDRILELPRMHVLWDSSRVPGTIVDVLVAHEPALAERSREMRALIRAYGAAQKYFEEHPEESVAILARRCGMSADSVRRSLGQMRLLAPNEQSDTLVGSLIREATRTTAEGLVAIGMLQAMPRRAPVHEGIHEGAP